MASQRTKNQNIEVIKNRLNVKALPSKFKSLPAQQIAIFTENPQLDAAIQIIIDQNETIKSANGRRLVAENRVAEFFNLSKSELLQLWNKLFGKVTQEDDPLLREMGAISRGTAKTDIERAGQIAEDAKYIVQGYRDKYGELREDPILWEIGAISMGTAKTEVERAEQIAKDAKYVAQKYRKKYGEP